LYPTERAILDIEEGENMGSERERKGASSSNSEYVVVQARVPKPIHDFLQAHIAYVKMSLDEWVSEAIKAEVDGLIDEISVDPAFGLDKDELVKKYGLEEFVT